MALVHQGDIQYPKRTPVVLDPLGSICALMWNHLLMKRFGSIKKWFSHTGKRKTLVFRENVSGKRAILYQGKRGAFTHYCAWKTNAVLAERKIFADFPKSIAKPEIEQFVWLCMSKLLRLSSVVKGRLTLIHSFSLCPWNWHFHLSHLN